MSLVSVLKPSSLVGVIGGSEIIGTVATVLTFIVGIGIVTLPLVFARMGWIGGCLIMGLLPCCLTWLAIEFYRAIETVRMADGRPLPSFPDIAHAAFGWKGRLFTAVTLYGEYALFLSVMMLTLAKEVLKYDETMSKNVAVVIVAGGLSPLAFIQSAALASRLSIVGVVGIVILCALLLVTSISEATQKHSSTREYDLVRFDPFQLGVSVANVMLVFSASGVIPTIVFGMKRPHKFPTVAKYVFSLATATYTTVGVSAYAAWGAIFIDGTVSVLELISEVDLTRKILLTVSLVLICLPQFGITAMVVNQGLDLLLVGDAAKTKRRVGRILLHSLQASIVLMFDRIEDFLNIISSFTNVIIVVILPAAICWKLRGTRLFSLVSIIFGLTVMAFGSYFAIDNSRLL